MESTNTRPVNIFVSYSHLDEKYQQKLSTALSPLRQKNLIKEWYDAKIVPGAEFNAVIRQRLSASDIIILLLSQSYLDSDYCWNTERELAVQLQQQNNVRVVGIVIKDVPLKGLQLSHHKLLPKDAKPIQRWHFQDEAWKSVCEGIELVINDLKYPSPVDDAIGIAKTIVETESAKQSHTNIQRVYKIQELDSVTEFWECRGSTVLEHSIVSLQGTFSQFAPMLMGAPKAKARLHKAFRQALETNLALRRKKGQSLDACLSVSAGQMVGRLQDARLDFIYFGLYNSIVRNSIPVLVAREYYNSYLASVFKACGHKTFEAQITGRVIKLDNSPAKLFMNKHARAFIPTEIVDDLCREVYGIVIDGAGTSVEQKGKARFLDGDIWIAVESDGSERFLTSFLDVANTNESKEELDKLFQRVQALPGPPRIIAQYDEDSNLVQDSKPVSNNNRFLDSIWRFGHGS